MSKISNSLPALKELTMISVYRESESLLRTAPANLLTFDFVQKPRPVEHPNSTDVLGRIAVLEADPHKAAALERARKRLAGHLVDAGETESSLRSLRLARGLSQAKLGEEIGTSQARIARIEAGREVPSIDFCAKLADILHVDMNAIWSAMRNRQNA